MILKTPLIIFCSTLSLGIAQAKDKSAKPAFTSAKETFEKVHRMLLKDHMGEISEEELYLAATKGMLKALNHNGRSWNGLLTPEQVAKLTGSMKNKEVVGIGVGVRFLPETGTVFVQEVVDSSPAHRSGLQKGDLILSINGKTYKNLSPQEMQKEMQKDIIGPEGESISLKFLRGDEVHSKKVVRKKVQWGPVESHVAKNFHQKPVGILKIKSFTPGTPELVKKHLMAFKGITGLIVDLRGNTGGVFDQAVFSIDHFLPKGKTIAMLRGRAGKQRNFISQKEPLVKVPVMVLVDRKTSAGAELMAANLRENLRAQLIGEQTYGKWNSQVVRRLPNNYAVRYTVHEFSHSPKHRFTGGLMPDVMIPTHIPSRITKSQMVFSTPRNHRTAIRKAQFDGQMRAAMQLTPMMK